MGARIVSVEVGTPAAASKLCAGDTLTAINGHKIEDVLDYKYYSYDRRLTLDLTDSRGKPKRVHIKKDEGEDVGLEFETYLMDAPRSCANRCMFCFVDQLPGGMRDTLYFKDDDARLSFLQGNYITLTNLSEREAERIVELKISPINVSVHTTDPQLRCRMLGSKNGALGIVYMKMFANAGITMNCQIVCCPGINNGEQLDKTMVDLAELYPSVNSVSIVPVGLTKHRQELYPLKPFTAESAGETIEQVEKYAARCYEKFGSKIFFCADELYLKAGRALPPDGFYEGYPQLENGVGMMRLLITEFNDALAEPQKNKKIPFSVATGVSAAPFIEKLAQKAAERLGGLEYSIYPVENEFFGTSIDVAGLVTGRDMLKRLNGESIGQRLLIPRNMLRHGEGVFLDDVTVHELEIAVGVPVRVVEQDGADLLSAMLGE